MTALSLPIPLVERRPINPWVIGVVVSIATFMEVLDTSIANVSLTHIAGNLSAGVDEATWVLTSYLVSNAIILPISGWLSTVFGRKRFYMSCVALFTISSLLCGLAPSLGMLIFFRVLQGIGGGGLAPSEQSILADTFSPKQRGMAFAMYGVAVVVAPAVGPTLGGWITDNYSWRWIFFINVPVGFLSLFLSYFLVADSKSEKEARKKFLAKGLRVDFVGLAAVTLGLGCMQVVLDKGERDDWFQSHFILGFTIISAVALVVLIVWELFVAEEPVVDLPLFKSWNFVIVNVLMFALGFILFGSTQLIPQLVQTLLGYTATDAGLVISPGGVLVICLMPLVGFLLGKVPAKWLIMVGMGLSSLACFHLSHFTLDISYKHAALARMLQASGIAFLFVPISTAAYAGIAKGKNNNASALVNLSRNLGGSFGISLAQTVLSQRSQYHRAHLSEHYSTLNPLFQHARSGLTSVLTSQGVGAARAGQAALGVLNARLDRAAGILAYNDIFLFMACGALALLPVILFLKNSKPGGGGAH